MLESFAAWLLLPLGIALGWYLRSRGTVPPPDDAHLRAETLTGMGHLVNDDPDQAVAALLRASELDSQAVELHLTLGTLLRKRGEIDRALRLHEALAQRDSLDTEQRQRVHFELAQDYWKAGLMDRAEALFQELSQRGPQVIAALEGLIALYEQAHDWQQALDANQRLEAVSAQPRQAIAAQYWCELAQEAQRRKDTAEAVRLARRALEAHPDCVRASLILGRLHEESGEPQAAIRALQRVPEQDPRFLPEIVEPLFRNAQAAGQLDGVIDFMREAEPEPPPSAAVLAQAQLMRETGMDPARYLAESFAARPSWALLEPLLEALQPPPDPSLAQAMTRLREALRKAAAGRIRYRCIHCGLTPGLLFWQCPTCKHWGSVIPADDRLAPPG